MSGNDNGSVSGQEGMSAPEITGITRLNDRLVVLTYAKSEGAEQYRVFRSSNEEDFIQAAAVREAYYYDWSAPVGETFTYYVVAEGASGDIGLRSARSRAQTVGFGARPVTNVASLMYHRFSSDEDIRNGAQNDSNRISPEELEGDLRYFRDNNIRTITCRELVQFWNGELALPQRCVLITVDDGHYSIYKHMVPLLEKYGCKANIAVIGSVTDWAVNRTEIPQKVYYLKWEEIADLGKLDSLEFGSHSYYLHKRGENKRNGTMIMENESLEEYRAVLSEDARLIREKLASASGYAPVFYVYPYGVLSPESIPILTEEAGYRVLLAGGSPSYYPTKGRAFAFGIGEEQLDSRLFRRFERYSGKDIAALLEAIWSDGNGAGASVTPPDGQEETGQY
jgi:peptidoglycan/xylan/chitin deacetylase (PgdA/CDA1 family)